MVLTTFHYTSFYFHLFCATFCITIASAKIPSYISVCKRNDPNMDACITNSILKLRPKLAEGIPELSLPSMDPLYLGTVQLTKNIDLNMTNANLFGITDFKIMELKSEIHKNRFAALLRMEKVIYQGDYVIDTTFVNIPLTGQGSIAVNITDVTVGAKLKARRVKMGENVYLKFESINLVFSYAGCELTVDGLLKNQPTLAKAATGVLQDNAKLLVDEVIPQLEARLGEQFTKIANEISSRSTYDELFPL